MTKWITTRERGSILAINIMVWMCRRCNHRLVSLLLYPIAAYFFVTSRVAHKASKRFFALATAETGWLNFYRQLLCFSRSLVDRITMLNGDADVFKVNHSGRDVLMNSLKDGRGLIMLGSHLGNFEACQLLADDRMEITIHVVAYFSGSAKVHQALDAINPALRSRLINPAEPDAVLRMRDVINKGGVLAVLGDRTGIGNRKVTVEFMGKPADFPSGPYHLAAILGCPVFCFFGLRTGPFAYDTCAIRLLDSLPINRRKREGEILLYAQKYADILAEKAREYPSNWFNFYEFWNGPTDSKP